MGKAGCHLHVTGGYILSKSAIAEHGLYIPRQFAPSSQLAFANNLLMDGMTLVATGWHVILKKY